MDIILGGLVAAILVAVCLGVGVAVRSAVDRLMGPGDEWPGRAPQRLGRIRVSETDDCWLEVGFGYTRLS